VTNLSGNARALQRRQHDFAAIKMLSLAIIDHRSSIIAMSETGFS